VAEPLRSRLRAARRSGLTSPEPIGISTGEAWHAWLTGKKRLRASSAERLEIAGRHWILPVLADVPLERLNGAHVAEVFTRIERLNAELIAKQGGSRSFVRLDGDVRTRPRHVVQPGLRRRIGAGGHARGHAVERPSGVRVPGLHQG